MREVNKVWGKCLAPSPPGDVEKTNVVYILLQGHLWQRFRKFLAQFLHQKLADAILTHFPGTLEQNLEGGAMLPSFTSHYPPLPLLPAPLNNYTSIYTWRRSMSQRLDWCNTARFTYCLHCEWKCSLLLHRVYKQWRTSESKLEITFMW